MTTAANTIQERVLSPMMMRPRADAALTPGDILNMLVRRAVMASVLSVLFTAMAMGGFMLWWYVFPGYRAESLIECVSNVPETSLTEERERMQQDEHERFVLSQAVLLKSPVILGEVLKITAVRETSWYKQYPQEDLLEELTSAIGAAPVRGTNYLRVSMETRDPRDPAAIVNEIVREWYRYVRSKSAESFAAESLEVAQTELESLDGDIETKRARLREIAERLPAGAHMNPQNTLLAQQANLLNEQVEITQLEMSQLEQYRALYTSPEGVVTPEDRQLVEQDPEVSELMRQLFLLRQQRAAQEPVYGANHAFMREIDSAIGATEQKLGETQLRKYGERKADIRQAVSSAFLATQKALFSLQERMAKTEDALVDQGVRLQEYTAVQKDVEDKLVYRQKLHEYVMGLRRVKDKQMAIQVNIAQPAIKPIKRNSPDPFLMIPFGIILAITLGVGLSLGLELLDKSIRTAQDISRHLDVPVLGAVPDTDDEEVSIDKVETAVRDAPRSMVAEAFRRIRTSLQFSGPAERQRSLLIASASPEDGRTTVAANLAIAMAQGGRRVLLVDANFRRPGLQNVFTGVKAVGLSNLLVGQSTLTECVVSTNVARLDVLGSGPLPPNPAELLGSDTLRTILQEASSKYDHVLFDSSPLHLATDSVVLATAVDGCVLVVRAKENSRGVGRRAVSMLAGVGAHVYGAVLNAAQVTRGGYFREQLRTFYDYQGETTAASKV